MWGVRSPAFGPGAKWDTEDGESCVTPPPRRWLCPYRLARCRCLPVLLYAVCTNFSVLNSCWEANSRLASREITPAFYGTRKFINVFTAARHWSVSWARWIQSTFCHPVSLRCVLILSCYLLICVANVCRYQVLRQKLRTHFSALPPP
jgi:glucan phosphoethanolaminetransferase (alkaline phosphatase superfamily)